MNVSTPGPSFSGGSSWSRSSHSSVEGVRVTLRGTMLVLLLLLLGLAPVGLMLWVHRPAEALRPPMGGGANGGERPHAVGTLKVDIEVWSAPGGVLEELQTAAREGRCGWAALEKHDGEVYLRIADGPWALLGALGEEFKVPAGAYDVAVVCPTCAPKSDSGFGADFFPYEMESDRCVVRAGQETRIRLRMPHALGSGAQLYCRDVRSVYEGDRYRYSTAWLEDVRSLLRAIADARFDRTEKGVLFDVPSPVIHHVADAEKPFWGEHGLCYFAWDEMKPAEREWTDAQLERLDSWLKNISSGSGRSEEDKALRDRARDRIASARSEIAMAHSGLGWMEIGYLGLLGILALRWILISAAKPRRAVGELVRSVTAMAIIEGILVVLLALGWALRSCGGGGGGFGPFGQPIPSGPSLPPSVPMPPIEIK